MILHGHDHSLRELVFLTFTAVRLERVPVNHYHLQMVYNGKQVLQCMFTFCVTCVRHPGYDKHSEDVFVNA